MGLDITAWAHVELIEAITIKAANACKPRHPLYDQDGVTMLYHWSAIRSDGLPEGFYRTSDECHAFGAGSYSGYNTWREQLASLVGTTPERVWAGKDEPTAFYELINFADNEGFIGPKTSAKLHADFVAHYDMARSFIVEDRDWFLRKYCDWMKAFEIAAKGGVVKFH
jgi:hypothetical protein